MSDFLDSCYRSPVIVVVCPGRGRKALSEAGSQGSPREGEDRALPGKEPLPGRAGFLILGCGGVEGEVGF